MSKALSLFLHYLLTIPRRTDVFRPCPVWASFYQLLPAPLLLSSSEYPDCLTDISTWIPTSSIYLCQTNYLPYPHSFPDSCTSARSTFFSITWAQPLGASDSTPSPHCLQYRDLLILSSLHFSNSLFTRHVPCHQFVLKLLRQLLFSFWNMW